MEKTISVPDWAGGFHQAFRKKGPCGVVLHHRNGRRTAGLVYPQAEVWSPVIIWEGAVFVRRIGQPNREPPSDVDMHFDEVEVVTHVLPWEEFKRQWDEAEALPVIEAR